MLKNKVQPPTKLSGPVSSLKEITLCSPPFHQQVFRQMFLHRTDMLQY